ncbi:MAG: hypothetical protein LBB53_04305, partial [Prevotellaceae bacterium]|nr:hypothetical protein [Prevotellaceae bacterium]
TQKGHRLRLAAGITYINGILAFDAIINDNVPVFMQTYYYNHIGANANLSYHFPLTKKLYLGINLKAYDRFDGIFLDYITFGCSVGYNF